MPPDPRGRMTLRPVPGTNCPGRYRYWWPMKSAKRLPEPPERRPGTGLRRILLSAISEPLGVEVDESAPLHVGLAVTSYVSFPPCFHRARLTGGDDAVASPDLRGTAGVCLDGGRHLGMLLHRQRLF